MAKPSLSEPLEDEVVDGGTRPLDAGFCLKADLFVAGVGGLKAGGGEDHSLTGARVLGRGECASKAPEVAITAPPNSSNAGAADVGACC